MKKVMISLMMVVAVTTTSFAKSNNTDVANAVKSVAEQVKQAPSGTVYGVVENTKHHITVATPFGKYTILVKNRVPTMPIKRSLGEHVMGSW